MPSINKANRMGQPAQGMGLIQIGCGTARLLQTPIVQKRTGDGGLYPSSKSSGWSHGACGSTGTVLSMIKKITFPKNSMNREVSRLYRKAEQYLSQSRDNFFLTCSSYSRYEALKAHRRTIRRSGRDSRNTRYSMKHRLNQTSRSRWYKEGPVQ